MESGGPTGHQSWRSTSPRMNTALVCLGAGLVAFVIGFASPQWVHHRMDARIGLTELHLHLDIGLWSRDVYAKVNGEKKEGVPLEDFDHAWFYASQAMECLGLMLMVPALVLLFLYVFLEQCRRRSVLLLLPILTLLSVFFTMIGVGVLATHSKFTYSVVGPGAGPNDFVKIECCIGWSMGFAIFGGLLVFVSGALQLAELYVQRYML